MDKDLETGLMLTSIALHILVSIVNEEMGMKLDPGSGAEFMCRYTYPSALSLKELCEPRICSLSMVVL